MKLGTTDISKIMVGSTEVTSGYLGTVSIFSSGPQPLDPTEPFYFENTSNTDGNISFTKNGSPGTGTLVYYSTDKTNWSTATVSENSLIPIQAHTKVYFKRTNAFAVNSYNYWRFRTTLLTSCSVGGNIMSLLYGTNFTGSETTIPNNSNGGYLQHLFYGVSTITDASRLMLPATTIRSNCYMELFKSCTALVTPPETLPATTLQTYCYQYMFNGCTSLTTAPTLPATTLVADCYYGMFYGCSALATPPTLPATTLASYCYYNMFKNCTSITTAPTLPATTLQTYCYSGMFDGCTSLTTPPVLPATTLQQSCYAYMFSGCTSLTTAPELPAETLRNSCYMQMFYNCSSLNYIKCLAIEKSELNTTTQWVTGVASSGTFVKNVNMTAWTDGISGIPANWTVQNYPEPQPSPVPQPTNGYFYFDNVGSSPVTVTLGGWGNPNEFPPMKTDLQYSTTGTSGWTNGFVGSYDEGEEFYTHFQFTVPANSKIYVRSNGLFYDKYESGEYLDEHFFIDGEVNIGGNPLSLIFGQSYTSNQSNMPDFAFSNVFSETPIVDASELYLPDYTTSNCYQWMFDYCKSLVTAPLLPATTLSYCCYGGMLEGCKALENVYCLAETDDESTNSWLREASATGTIVVSSNSCLALDTEDGVPTGWTIVIA